MRIATWNVNSIRARLERLLAWLEKVQPDVLCLQEIKCTNQQFPYEAIREAGYHVAVAGQKTYHGVAILSRQEPQDVQVGLDDGEDEGGARLLLARFGEVVVLDAYVPNGTALGSEKFTFKLRWLERLARKLRRECRPEELMVYCADSNVILRDEDAAHMKHWADTVLGCPPVREAFQPLLDWGLVDLVRVVYPTGGVYSWWDYRGGAWGRNDGCRIDHILATPPMAERCVAVQVDRAERAGESPSDHAPVVADFSGF